MVDYRIHLLIQNSSYLRKGPLPRVALPVRSNPDELHTAPSPTRREQTRGQRHALTHPQPAFVTGLIMAVAVSSIASQSSDVSQSCGSLGATREGSKRAHTTNSFSSAALTLDLNVTSTCTEQPQ
ncbi:hypothetical protein PF005_g26042 [Phytophthora fragariae]|uniref:Uncharacterized protein n=1 Tax=Phytophthora fragariae TaxID=53985 RepID=A0A6A3UH51_9STRA|nr:hypothetical protein PF003_g26686 [Phytophthora fragariae]KAE8941181.1 hypothetical protein PF009_g9015 [Phytophthora fragariae]KAE9118379.1 hypothetical protein PF007_g8944 [Phytophthora fragariae]KAE9150189.1 hypothetical protein PF006_g5405 [Phytophthora fragariae]KAE9173995.1 hypothetical protein PF005_g26042 [Phytophthora fragariae]